MLLRFHRRRPLEQRERLCWQVATMTAKDPRTDLADWLHSQLVREYANETESWALERVARVERRLNAARPGQPALEATILWIAPPLAFTPPGKHVYISRSLLERLPSRHQRSLTCAFVGWPVDLSAP